MKVLRKVRENIIVTSLRKLLRILPNDERRKSYRVFLLGLLNSILELVGLATLIPLLSLLLRADAVSGITWLADFRSWAGLESEATFITVISLGIGLAFICKNLLSLWIYKQQANFAFGLFRYFSSSLLQWVYLKGYPWLREHNSNKVFRDVYIVPQWFSNQFMVPILQFLNELVIAVLIVLGLLIFRPVAVILVAVIIAPAFILFYRINRNRLAALGKQQHSLTGELQKDLYQSIQGYIDVEITGSFQFFFEIFKKGLHKISSVFVTRQVLLQMPAKVMETATVIGVLTLVVIGYFIIGDRAQLALTLGVFALGAYRLMPSVNRMMGSLMLIKNNAYTLDILIRTQELDVDESNAQTRTLSFQSGIELMDLGFKFPDGDQFVFRHLNLKIDKGECVGIIGPSGSGKSTLLKVFLGFIPAVEGKILVDNETLGRENLHKWRRLAGFVQQEVYLLDTTLAGNIAFGDPDPDRNRVEEMVVRAGLTDLLGSLPKGIDTPIGELGSRLSGGQRQRVAIARALYSGAEILFFDEATSALDSETEHSVTEAIAELNREGISIIIVAHRHSTLKFCNRILELKPEGYQELDYLELTNN